MYKVLRQSSNGQMLRLSDEKGTEKWFWLGEKVVSFAKNIKPNDTIDIRAERKNNKDYITFLKTDGPIENNRGGGYQPKTSMKSSTPPQGGSATGRTYQSRNEDTQRSIVRQSTMASASRIVASLGLDSDPEKVLSVFDEVYAHLLKKVNE